MFALALDQTDETGQVLDAHVVVLVDQAQARVGKCAATPVGFEPAIDVVAGARVAAVKGGGTALRAFGTHAQILAGELPALVSPIEVQAPTIQLLVAGIVDGAAVDAQAQRQVLAVAQTDVGGDGLVVVVVLTETLTRIAQAVDTDLVVQTGDQITLPIELPVLTDFAMADQAEAVVGPVRRRDQA